MNATELPAAAIDASVATALGDDLVWGAPGIAVLSLIGQSVT